MELLTLAVTFLQRLSVYGPSKDRMLEVGWWFFEFATKLLVVWGSLGFARSLQGNSVCVEGRPGLVCRHSI